MNRSSGAAMTQYKNCNHDKAAAKSRIKYQMGVIGSECDEVWYEKISNKKLCKTQFFSVRIIALMHKEKCRALAFYSYFFKKRSQPKNISTDGGSTYLTRGSSERQKRSTSLDFLPERFEQRTHTCHQQIGSLSSFSSGCCPCTPSEQTHPSPCT